MNRRALRALVLVTGAALFAPAVATAEGTTELAPVVVDAPVPCRTSVDPGFVATIEDRSNDTGFIATHKDVSNDSGFLQPVPTEPGPEGQTGPLCAWVVPLPGTDVAP